MALLKFKRSAVPAKVPSIADLDLGELAINTYDGKVYTKKDDGTQAIVEVGGGGGVQTITSSDGSVTVTGTTDINLSVPVTAATNTVILPVRNNTGATLAKGTAVYINGALGQNPTVTKAIATGDATSAQTLGLVTADINNNSVGNVTLIGTLTNVDTSAFSDGQQLYLSPTTAGALTATKPYAPSHLVYMAVVEHAHPALGKLFVKVQNGYEMDELHNVAAQSPANNDGLFYNTSTSLWEKKSIATALGYTPANKAGDTFTGSVTIPELFVSDNTPTFTSSAFQYHLHQSPHVAYVKQTGGYSWYWRRNSTGTLSGTDEVEDMSLTEGGNLIVRSDVRAPIFYDSPNTEFFLDASSTGTALSTNGILIAGTGTAGGLQNRAFTSGRNRIWSFANADSYGISYFQGGPDYIGLHVSGTASQAGSDFWANSEGIAQARVELRAPIFRDSNNGAFYLDPDGTSRLERLVLSARYDNYFVGSMAVVNAVNNFQTLTDTFGQMNVMQVSDTSGFTNAPTGLYPFGGVMSWRTENHSYQMYASHTGDLAYKTQWNNDNYSGWQTPVVYGRNSNSSSGKTIYGSIFYDSASTGYNVGPSTSSTLANVLLTSTVDSALYYDAALEIRERSFGGVLTTSFNNAPRLAFHWGGRVAMQLALGSDNTLNVMNGDCSGFTPFRAGDISGNVFTDRNNTAYYFDGDEGSRQGKFLTISGNTSGIDGNELVVGNTAVTYSMRDTNLRPIIQAHGAYPVLSLNHTVTANTLHGPTVQFTANGTGKQFVIGMSGNGSQLDIGNSAATDWNPHNGIGGYNGITGWRMDGAGNVYNLISSRSPIFRDNDNTAFFVDPDSTSNLNKLTASNRSMVGSAQISMAGLDANTWYPVTIPIPIARQTTLRIENALNSNVPPWSTHPAGFSCYIEWTTNGAGYGTIGVSRRITDWRESFTNVQIVGGITQLTNGSEEVIWLRGGANYFFSADCDVTPTIRTTSYELYGQTVAPRSSIFNNPRDAALGRAAFGSFQTNEQSLFRGNIDISTGSPQIVFTSTTSGRAASFGMTDAYNMLLNAPSGGVLYLSEFRAPMFRDNDNSAYYVDPAETSQLKTVETSGGIGFRAYSNGSASVNSQFYFANAANSRAWNWQLDENNNAALWNYNGSSWDKRFTFTAGSDFTAGGNIQANAGIFTNNASSRVLYLKGAGNIIQFQDADGTDRWENVGRNGTYYVYKNYGTGMGFKWQIDDNGNQIFNGIATFNTEVRSPIFRDSDNTAYYWNFADGAVSYLNTQILGLVYYKCTFGNNVYSSAVSSPPLQVYSEDGGTAMMSFHRAGAYAVNMGLDPDNVLRIGGWSASANRFQMDMSGNLTMAGNVTAYSDARLKKDVSTVANALELVSKMRGVTYTRTDTGEAGVGVIAQEMLEVMPQVVQQGIGDDDTLSVAYGNLVGVLIEAIKELRVEVETLKNRS